MGSDGAGNGPLPGPGNAVAVFGGQVVVGGNFIDRGGDGAGGLHRPLPGCRPPADGGHPARKRRLLPVRRVHGLVRRQRQRRRRADRRLPLELQRRLGGRHRPDGRPPPDQAGNERRHPDRDRQPRAHRAGQRGLLHRRSVPAGAVHLVSRHRVRRGTGLLRREHVQRRRRDDRVLRLAVGRRAADASAAKPTHTFAKPGTYQVALFVLDDNTQSGAAIHNVDGARRSSCRRSATRR